MTLQDLLLRLEWSVKQMDYCQHCVNKCSVSADGMGYANLEQVTAGIHQRLWSRAFILANTMRGPRIVLVTLDAHPEYLL